MICLICFFALHLLYRTPFSELNPQEKNFLNNFLLSVLRHVPDNIFYHKGVFNGNYTANIHPNRRNYCLIVMGLNTALRISGLLKLKWDNVYNFEHHVFRSHFLINEQKTGKNNYVTLNYNATDALRAYFNERHPTEHEFIFTKATCRRQPINRVQAYRIVRTAAEETVQDERDEIYMNLEL